MDTIDWNFKSVSLVLLGAGFSSAATAGKMPLMSSFFDTLEHNDFPELFEFISCMAYDFRTANVEKVLLFLEQIRTSPDALLDGWADKWKANAGLLRRELIKYILWRLQGCADIPDDNWAAGTLASCGRTTTVISMNYDNVAERILSAAAHSTSDLSCPHCKMCHLLEKACSCSGRQVITGDDWRGSLIKLHGSIAWKRCVNPQCCSYECLVADRQCRPFEPCFCPNCQQDCEPVLVMPTMSKNLEEVREIAAMWQAARSAIADAESIVLFGFSMPTSDELLVQMLRSTIYGSRRLNRVAAIDLDPDGVISRFKNCVPDDCAISYSSFKVIPGKTPEWLIRRD